MDGGVLEGWWEDGMMGEGWGESGRVIWRHFALGRQPIPTNFSKIVCSRLVWLRGHTSNAQFAHNSGINHFMRFMHACSVGSSTVHSI